MPLGTRSNGNQRNPGEGGDEVWDVEDNEGNGAEEQESQVPAITGLKSNKAKISSIQKKTCKCKLPTAKFDDQHLAVFIYSHLLPQMDSQALCWHTVLDCLYENNRLGG